MDHEQGWPASGGWARNKSNNLILCAVGNQEQKYYYYWFLIGSPRFGQIDWEHEKELEMELELGWIFQLVQSFHNFMAVIGAKLNS